MTSNLYWQNLQITKKNRSLLLKQKPQCLWFTGLSGAGKSTIANFLEQKLNSMGLLTYTLDGDNIRQGLNNDLGFSESDRAENIRRVAEVSKLMVDAGLIVVVSFISPFKSERQFARSLFEEGEFIEIYINTPISECEKRDPKGLYAMARRGELSNFTGIDSAYEQPENAEIIINTDEISVEDCVDSIFCMIKAE